MTTPMSAWGHTLELQATNPRWLPLIPCPHPARHALQSTTSDRSHAVGFYCRLTCGGSTFSVELGPPRNASIHASETECSPGSLTLSLASGVTRANVVTVGLCDDFRGAYGWMRPCACIGVIGVCPVITHGSTVARARNITVEASNIIQRVIALCACWSRSHESPSHDGQSKHQLSHFQFTSFQFLAFSPMPPVISADRARRFHTL